MRKTTQLHREELFPPRLRSVFGNRSTTITTFVTFQYCFTFHLTNYSAWNMLSSKDCNLSGFQRLRRKLRGGCGAWRSCFQQDSARFAFRLRLWQQLFDLPSNARKSFERETLLRQSTAPPADLFCLLRLSRNPPVQFKTPVTSALKRIFKARNRQLPSAARPLIALWLARRSYASDLRDHLRQQVTLFEAELPPLHMPSTKVIHRRHPRVLVLESISNNFQRIAEWSKGRPAICACAQVQDQYPEQVFEGHMAIPVSDLNVRKLNPEMISGSGYNAVSRMTIGYLLN